MQYVPYVNYDKRGVVELLTQHKMKLSAVSGNKTTPQLCVMVNSAICYNLADTHVIW